MYKSQSKQDEWVDSFFERKENGFFLDIGAYDGVELSNSYFFEKVRKWNGICVEGNISIFNSLLSNRTCKCVNGVISSKQEKVLFKNAGLIGSINNSEGTEITTTTLTHILQENKTPSIIDYMSLDIEGHEYDALLGFPWTTHTIILLTVEHNAYSVGDVNKNKLYNLLSTQGYTRVKEDVEDQGLKYEDWYIKTEYLK
jgi:FkbM family methyltransferase